MIKSLSYNQSEILQGIVDLHTGPLEADVTFGSGCFYKKSIPLPAFCFDLVPRVPGVIAADVCQLPLKDSCLNSVMFDPPFMARTGPGATLKARFGELIGTTQDLWRFYFLAMKEIHRVLIPGGWFVFKCQDGVLSGKNNFTHCEIYNMATTLGFIRKDLFILGAHHRMNHPDHHRQIHARKHHSYFWVFQKNSKKGRADFQSRSRRTMTPEPLLTPQECAKDNYPDGPFCEILGKTITYRADDPNYPREWTYAPNGNPVCKGFEGK